MFNSIQDVKACFAGLPRADEAARQAAEARNAVLTKPAGALGRLEELAIWFAQWRQSATPAIDTAQIIIFAANHGVAAQGVSAFPAEVTAQMVANFETGGAAINQLAKLAHAELTVVPIALDTPTGDFTQGAAMDDAAFLEALNIGASAVSGSADVLVLGEMGIGNTTSAAAIYHALLGGDPLDWVGRGTGVDDAGLSRKAEALRKGVLANPTAQGDPLMALQSLGGREIAAMFGAMMAARVHRIPVILDGFIASSAALVAFECDQSSVDHIVAGHVSDEQAHRRVLDHMGKAPLLDLSLRLGEGSGAAVALNILRAALCCHNGMASFEQAGVSGEE